MQYINSHRYKYTMQIILQSTYIHFSAFAFLGCPSGYYGSNCSDSCRYPNYGVECQEECLCPKKVCDHVFGCLDYAFDGKERERENEKEGYLLLKMLFRFKITELNLRFWKKSFLAININVKSCLMHFHIYKTGTIKYAIIKDNRNLKINLSRAIGDEDLIIKNICLHGIKVLTSI